MIWSKQARWGLTFVIVLAMLCTIAPRLWAEEASPVIRVAYPLQPGMTDINDKGQYTGYTYEYLQEIAQYTGWNYEFVQVTGGTNDEKLIKLLKMLTSGEIDLMGGILYQESLLEQYDYASCSYGNVYTVLQVLSDNANSDVGTQMQQSIRVAAITGSKVYTANLEEYCARNHIKPEYVWCQDEDEQLQALRQGQADVLLNTSANYIPGVRTIVQFAGQPFYFITTKGNTQLLQELNAAIGNIERMDPNYAGDLHEKYFANNSTTDILLTEEEKRYIEQSEPFQVGVLLERSPYQYRGKDGQLKGISIDLLDFITEKTGLRFELIAADTPEELGQLRQQGKLDLISMETYDYASAQRQQLALSRPYVSAPYFVVLNEAISQDSLAGKKLVLCRDSTYDGPFIGEVSYLDNLEECMQAVNSGLRDYTYGDSYMIQYYINQLAFGHLYVVPQAYKMHDVCFGVTKPVDPLFLSILNKAVLNASLEDIQAMVYDNTINKQSATLTQWMKRNPLQSIGVIALIALSVIIALGWGLYNRARLNKAMALDLKKRLEVYEMVNEYFLEYDFAESALMISQRHDQPQTEGMLIYRHGRENPHLSQQDCQRYQCFVQAILQQFDGVLELQCPDKSGGMRWLKLVLKTIRDEDGAPQYTIGKINDIESDRQERDKLLAMAQRDSLTNLYNAETSRRLITEALDALPKHGQSALLLLDVDSFKGINDTYGHMKGDEMLQQVADILRSSFSGDDILGRPGGDEFVIYMQNLSDQAALAEKCLKLCQSARLVEPEIGCRLTVSVGAVLAAPGQSYNDLYHQADMALYAAKAQGRDGYVID